MTYAVSIGQITAAAEKAAGLDGWMAYRWEAVEGGSLVTGDVPIGFISRGKNKGCPKWSANSKNKRRVLVSDDQMQQIAAAYEADTGLCWDCQGTGKTFASWSAKEGTTYRKCSRCDGSGKSQIHSTEGSTSK